MTNREIVAEWIEDAVEGIDYNMVRGVAYMGQYKPYIAYTMKSLREDYE